MNKLAFYGVLASAGLMIGCGGGSGIGGDGAGSFYNLNVILDNASIESKTVNIDSQGNITLPFDTITGKVSLAYTGSSSNPLRAVVKEASLCILDNCYTVPVSGVIAPNGQPFNLNMQINSHKVGLPWIAINPYEDKIVQTEMVEDNLTSGVSIYTTTSTYLNSSKTETLSNIPVAKNSVAVSYTGSFKNQMTVNNYSSPNKIVLDKGITTLNSITPNSVSISVGSNSCNDDGAGNITGGCTGTINYNTGELTLNGITNQTVSIQYEINGMLLCMDDGNGLLGQDCVGSSINYSSGQLTYKFKYTISNIPATVNVQYGQGQSSSNYTTYNLPAKTVAGQYTYNTYGRIIEVYQGQNKLCDNQGDNLSCNITRTGDSVKVQFSGSVPQSLKIKYSKDLKVDINPTVDASLYNGSYNGSTNPTITATLRIKVKLEDGSTLTATTPITFHVIP